MVERIVVKLGREPHEMPADGADRGDLSVPPRSGSAGGCDNSVTRLKHYLHAMSENTPEYTIAEHYDPDREMSPNADPLSAYLTYVADVNRITQKPRTGRRSHSIIILTTKIHPFLQEPFVF